MLAGASVAVADGPHLSDDEFAITSTESSASGTTTALGSDGTEYEAGFSVFNRSADP